MTISNLFQLPSPLPSEELFESLLQGDNIRVERIVSCGQVTPPNQWYDQDQDEWVILLRGRATLILAETTATRIDLEAGDYLFIPAHQKHRVELTSQEPPCIWLAIHGQLTSDQNP
jgi:cupin 2 domain-containing protein